MRLRLLTLVAFAAGAALVGGPAMAQKFSSPETAPASGGEEAGKSATVTPAGIRLPSGLYDEKADPVKDITRARERARKDNRNVVLMWGENNCEFCVHLHRLYHDDPRIRQLMETEYELVKVDIGKFEKNIELARDVYNTDLMSLGAPDLTVVNPATNQAIAVMAGKDALAKPMTMQRVFDADYVYEFLDSNKPQPKPAVPLFNEARQKAKREDKRVLVYFTIYGSESAKAWTTAASGPKAEPILEKAFVLRKIDVDRNPGGYELLRRLKGSQTASPPWMTVVDAEGKPVAEAGNGLEFDPEAAAEAAGWVVDASGGKLTAEDRAALAEALAPAKPEAEAAADAGRE